MRIDKNIPIPPTPYQDLKKILRELDIGDSFLLPKEVRNSDVPSCAEQVGIKTRQRKSSDGTTRIWRIS